MYTTSVWMTGLLGVLLGSSALAKVLVVDEVQRIVNLPSFTVSSQGQDLSEQRQGQFELEAEWENQITTFQGKYLISSEEIPEECDLTKNAIWKQYYSSAATRADKIDALSKINGISTEEAAVLYQYWPESRPPQNWYEFERLLSRLNGKYDLKIYIQPVGTYGASNRELLTYSEECFDQIQYEKKFVEEVSTKIPLESETIIVEFFVQGGKLLEGERESFHFSYDGELRFKADSAFNSYKVLRSARSDHRIEVYIEGRRKLAFPLNDNDGEVVIKQIDGEERVFLKFKHSEKNISRIDSGQQYVYLIVKTKKQMYNEYNWLTFRDRLKLEYLLPKTDDEEVEIDTGYNLGDDDRAVYIRYQVFYKNSEFFSNSRSLGRNTSELVISN